MSWQEWIQNNYHWLENYAATYGDLKSDCLTHLAFYFQDGHWAKFQKIKDSEKPKWIRAFFRNQVRWTNSQLNRDNRVNNLTEEQIQWFETAYDTPDNSHLEIEVSAEDANSDVKEWIADCRLEFGDDRTDKLLQIRLLYYKSLTWPEQILYGLYFDEMLTHRQIAQRLRIPLTSSFFMVKKLETKLIELCNLTGTQSFL